MKGVKKKRVVNYAQKFFCAVYYLLCTIQKSADIRGQWPSMTRVGTSVY